MAYTKGPGEHRRVVVDAVAVTVDLPATSNVAGTPSVPLTGGTPKSATGVFADVIGQPEAVGILRTAVAASHGEADVPVGAMTHAWLFTGPPGSGRSVAARAFAAAL